MNFAQIKKLLDDPLTLDFHLTRSELTDLLGRIDSLLELPRVLENHANNCPFCGDCGQLDRILGEPPFTIPPDVR